MKTRILAAIAIAVALPTVAQANSAMTERWFEIQSQPLNTQQTAEHQALQTRYTVDTVDGGHSQATDTALRSVAESTQLSTRIPSGNNNLAAQGHSAAAAQALENVGSADTRQGHVNFAAM